MDRLDALNRNLSAALGSPEVQTDQEILHLCEALHVALRQKIEQRDTVEINGWKDLFMAMRRVVELAFAQSPSPFTHAGIGMTICRRVPHGQREQYPDDYERQLTFGKFGIRGLYFLPDQDPRTGI